MDLNEKPYIVTTAKEAVAEHGVIAALKWLDQINGAVDLCIYTFTNDAVDAGHTWAEIGDALGISRQAAQQRYARQNAR